MTACVLDTDVVIAALDRSDAHHNAAARALRRLTRDRVRLLLSLMNYAETLVRPAEDPKVMRAAVAAIDALGLRLVAPTPQIARDAALVRGLGVSLADGFALATARAYSASVATFDRRVRSVLPQAGADLASPFR